MARKVWVPAVSGPLAPYAVGFESWQHLIDGRGALDYVRVSVHHSVDLLTGPRLPHPTAEKPCSGGHLSLSPGRNNRHYAVDPGSVLSAAQFRHASVFPRCSPSAWGGGTRTAMNVDDLLLVVCLPTPIAPSRPRDGLEGSRAT